METKALPSGHDAAARVGVAEALLALPEPDAEAAWQQLPRDALLAEVSRYRNSIREVADCLHEVDGAAGRGLPLAENDLLLQHRTAGNAAAAPGRAATSAGLPADGGPENDPDDSELLQMGEDGLDYTLGNVDDVDPSEWQVPPHCVPIHANVTTFDWPSLYEHCQFDVVMMDPPWQLATANPTRGVALGYSQLNDDHIASLPVPQLQRNGGFLFVWVINAKYKWTLDLFDRWGYRLVDEVVWVKMTVNRRLAKSHGYYLQHAKEVCLVAKYGNPPALAGVDGVGSDIIFSERRGQSQKPEEIYELIEQLVPNGRYLEIFARKNNLRDYWVSIGNEVTGTGLPEEDLRALKELNCIPGAVYGKTGGGGGSGRATSAGSGGTAAADAGASGTAAPSGRAASSGGGGATVAGGRTGSAGAGATSSRVGASGRTAAQRPPGQAHSSGSGRAGAGAGDSKAALQRGTEPPGKPRENGANEGVANASAAAEAQARQQLPRSVAAAPPAALPPSQQQQPSSSASQQQTGGVRPISRLSLSIRRKSQQLPPPAPLPQQQQPAMESAASPAGGDQLPVAMDTDGAAVEQSSGLDPWVSGDGMGALEREPGERSLPDARGSAPELHSDIGEVGPGPESAVAGPSCAAEGAAVSCGYGEAPEGQRQDSGIERGEAEGGRVAGAMSPLGFNGLVDGGDLGLGFDDTLGGGLCADMQMGFAETEDGWL